MIAAGIILIVAVLALAVQHTCWSRRYERDTGRLADNLADEQQRNRALVVEAAGHHVLMHRAADEIRDIRTFLAVETERADAAETALRGALTVQKKRQHPSDVVPMRRRVT